MSKVSRFFKSAGRKVGKVFPGTGKHAAKRAEESANKLAAEATAEREALDKKNKKERARANKIAARGLRSKRSASFLRETGQDSPSYGSPTIG